jgi:hypothetical protein
MTAFWQLLRRELRSRRDLLLASLLIGALVAFTPVLAGAHGARALELRGVAALAVALLWSGLLAVGLGVTFLARDLGERRLAFDFRLPTSSTAIWGARLLGAAITLLCCALTALAVPALFGVDFAGASAGLDLWTILATRSGDWRYAHLEGVLILAPVGLAALFLLANLAGLAILANRTWSALDLASFAGIAAALTVALGELFHWGASDAVPFFVSTAAALVLVGLLLATWLQVARGRTEPSRAHRAAALTLLVTCLVAGGTAIVGAHRLAQPSWSRINPARCWVDPVGGRLFLFSASRPHLVRFLYDRQSGEALALGPCAGGTWCSVVASDDGRTIAWVERPGTGHGLLPTTLHLLRGDLRSARATSTETPIVWPESVLAWDLSPDGDRVISRHWEPQAHSNTVVLEEIATGKTLRSVRASDCDKPGWIFFRDRNSALMSCTIASPVNAAKGWTVLLIDLSPGSSSRLEKVSFDAFHTFARLFSRLALRQYGNPGQLWLAREDGTSAAVRPSPDAARASDDRETGAPQSRFQRFERLPLAESTRSGVFCDDGRFVGVLGRDERTSLAVWTKRGVLERTIPLEDARQIGVFGPTRDQRSVLVLWNSDQRLLGFDIPWAAELVNLESGDRRALGSGLRIRGENLRDHSTVVVSRAGEEEELLWFDPESGTLEPLFPRKTAEAASP